MMSLRSGARLLVLTLMAAGCAPETSRVAPAPTPSGSNAIALTDASTSADIHSALLNPGSDALYAAEAETPVTAGDWAGVEAAAAKMADGARLMQGASRSEGRAEWLRISRQVEVAAMRAADAARNKDSETLAAADGEFTAQCEDCHNAFRDAPGRSMMSEPAP